MARKYGRCINKFCPKANEAYLNNKMNKKLLTLAVPTYNMEKYLARCLDSVLCENQDYLEVLVVNDGSTDNSSAIAHEYEAKYPNVIRVIDKENGNYGSCVNRAMDEATGKYFRMLDADDWCNTDALNQWLEELKTCDADMVLTVSEDRGEDNNLLVRMEAPQTVVPNKVYHIKEFDGQKLGYKYLYCSHIVTYKTEILRSIGLKLDHGISYTDNEYVYFPMHHCKTVVYYDLPIYQYFIGREGQTTDSKVMAKSVNQIIQVFNRLWVDFIENKDKRPIAIANNQRILLETMITWIYRPVFSGVDINTMKSIVTDLEPQINQDESIAQNIHQRQYIRYGVDVYAYYLKTGRFLNHPITKIKLQLHRIIRLIMRKVK